MSLKFKDFPLRTRRVLSLYKVYDDSTLLVLNGTSLNSDMITPFWLSTDDISEEGNTEPGLYKLRQQQNSYFFCNNADSQNCKIIFPCMFPMEVKTFLL